MPAAKRLLTGPFGAGARERLLAEARGPGSGVWIVPGPLARAQVRAALGRSRAAGRGTLVWSWADLWQAVRDEIDDGPSRLSDPAVRAALSLAIAQAREAGELKTTAAVADWPGFRRRALERIFAWTRREVSLDDDVPVGEPNAADLWAIFRRYRAVLEALRAEDRVGLAVWASQVLRDSPPPVFRKLGQVTILDHDDDAPATRRAIEVFEKRAKSVRITLGFDPDPALADAFAAVAPIRTRLLDRGYAETTLDPDLLRPRGLTRLERELFRDDAHARPPLDDAAGLMLRGGPRGEGVGLLIAKCVRDRLMAGVVCPEDILVLTRSWDDDAEEVFRVLRSWDLPVSAPGRPRRLATEPAVAALRLAIRLPDDDYEAASIARLLRHGQFQLAETTPESRAFAATTLLEAPVYRGRAAIRTWFDQELGQTNDEGLLRRLLAARDLVNEVIATVESLAPEAAWRDHNTRLLAIARRFGLGGEADDALERLADALADVAHVAENAGAPRVDREGYVAAVERVIHEHVEEDDAPARPGTVVVATLDRAAGARASVVILTNLVEGTFPTREAVAADDDPERPGRPGLPYAREMARFLRVMGAADEELILAYPTRDEKGQELLPAGFLDDLKRRLDPEVRGRVSLELARLDPALLDRPELALAPADQRVRAVALAATRNELGELASIASEPRHRRSLWGTARALIVGEQRLKREFTRFDGRLTDPGIVVELMRRFGPNSHFSASMLESYLTCPYQFFLKFVLGIRAVSDREEFEENYERRGIRIHDVLETLEGTLSREGGDRLDVARVVYETRMEAELRDVGAPYEGLALIERRRLEAAIAGYVRQADDYETATRENARGVRPTEFELRFGDERRGAALPAVRIGEGDDSFLLIGSIDRVDLVETDAGPRFRVIDYKTGPCPSKTDVRNHVMVQLPLYAMAFERLERAGETTGLHDVGYWSLRGDGFKPIRIEDWPAHREALERAVLEAVARLRRGVFDVASRKEHCTQYCDYGSACRIRQVRNVGKRSESDPS